MLNLLNKHANIILNDTADHVVNNLIRSYSDIYNILHLSYDRDARKKSEHKYIDINFALQPSTDDILNKIEEHKYQLEMVWIDRGIPFNASQCVHLMSECLNRFGITLVISMSSDTYKVMDGMVRIPYYTFLCESRESNGSLVSRRTDRNTYVKDFQLDEEMSIENWKDRLDTSLRLRHILGKD